MWGLHALSPIVIVASILGELYDVSSMNKFQKFSSVKYALKMDKG
jgi:hypothetical protein